MINQHENETRAAYIMRVAAQYIRNTPEFTIDYDETTCDGYCLADELEIHSDVGFLKADLAGWLEELGLVAVPIEPTDERLKAAHHCIDWCRDGQETHENENKTQTAYSGTSCRQDLIEAYAVLTGQQESSNDEANNSDNSCSNNYRLRRNNTQDSI